jgi:hypothetical protein
MGAIFVKLGLAPAISVMSIVLGFVFSVFLFRVAGCFIPSFGFFYSGFTISGGTISGCGLFYFGFVNSKLADFELANR